MENFGFNRMAAAALISVLASPVTALANAPAGRAVTVIGTVTLKHEGGKTADPLRPAMIVSQGDVIETAANGKAKILLNDKTVLDLNASTTFKVEQFAGASAPGERQVALKVEQGKVRTAVSEPLSGKGKFIIKTKTTTMGVRGTEFIVASMLSAAGNGGAGAANTAKVNTEITVVQGRIEVTDMTAPGGRPIELTTGKQLVSVAQVDLSSGQVMRMPAAEGGNVGGGGESKSSEGKSSDSKNGESKSDDGKGSDSGKSSSEGKSADSTTKSGASGDSAAKGAADGGANTGSGPMVREVPPAQLNEMRNDSKIGDLSMKDAINIENKSSNREAAPPPAQMASSTSQEGAKKQDRGPASNGGPPGGEPSKGGIMTGMLDGIVGSVMNGAMGPGPDGKAPGGMDFGRVPPPNPINNPAFTIPTNSTQPTSGNVSLTVRFTP